MNQETNWEEVLTPEQYEVLRNHGTERPFSSDLNYNKDSGVYMCAACGVELFHSEEKFDSGSGWPSFGDPVSPGVVELHEDTSYGMKRIEVRCSNCKGHLGHVFPDGPTESGNRYCINGVALDFEKEGKSKDTEE